MCEAIMNFPEFKKIMSKHEDHEDHEDHAMDPMEKAYRRAWKKANPKDTIKRQERLLHAGAIQALPWNTKEFQDTVEDPSVYLVDFVPQRNKGELRGFGTEFPESAVKGDMFLRTDNLPSILYKYNGTAWIEVDKAMSDQHAYDDSYIDYLIDKLGSGEYDPELLSDSERDQIEQRLKSKSDQA